MNVTLQGKNALVTGANAGIGKVTATELARAGAHVILGCRSEERANAAMAEIRAEVPAASLELLQLDLGDLANVRAAAERFLATERPLHLLINNAGLAGVRGVTADGFELHYGVNHLGHYLLTRLLLPSIRAAASALPEGDPARIVHVSSRAHYRAKHGVPFDKLREPTASTTGLPQYSVSKLCNVLFSNALARRFEASGEHIRSYSLHPGVVASEIWRNVPGPVRWLMKLMMVTNEEGAQTSLHCATDPGAAAENGLYYDERKPKKASGYALDEALGERLWTVSAEQCGLEA